MSLNSAVEGLEALVVILFAAVAISAVFQRVAELVKEPWLSLGIRVIGVGIAAIIIIFAGFGFKND